MSTNEAASSKRAPRTVRTAGRAAERELADFPQNIRNRFLFALEQVSLGLQPVLPVRPLQAVGPGVVELKINGSPAYRLVYTLKFDGYVVVLAARRKTTNGPDKQLIEVTASRLKDWKR